jgi:hypothetical protein
VPDGGLSCPAGRDEHGTFTPMSPTRTVAATALVAVLSFASACGGSSVDPDGDALASGDPTTPAVTPTATLTATPTTAPATKATRKPKPTPTDEGGDGDADGDKAPSTAGGGVCSHIGASQVAAIVGVSAMQGAAVDGVTGCKFDQGGKRGMSVTVLDKSAAEAGGMDGAKTEATSAVEGTPEDIGGLGSAAFVVTGTTFGGPDVIAAGAVQVGNRIVSVFLVQRNGLAESKVRTFEMNLLKLVADAPS